MILVKSITEKIPMLNRHVESVLKDAVIPETVIHDTVPSHRGVLAGCSAEPMHPLPNVHGFQYLKSLLQGDRFARTNVHLFGTDDNGIFDLLQSHGMSIHGDLSLRDNRPKVLQHIFHGDCFRDIEDDAHLHRITLPYGCSLAAKSHTTFARAAREF